MGLRLYLKVCASGLGLPLETTLTRVGKRVRGPRRDHALRAVACRLAVYANDATGANVFPRVDKLAFDTGLHRTAVIRAVRQLRDLGVLRVVDKARGRKTTRYVFVAEALPPRPPRPPSADEIAQAAAEAQNRRLLDEWRARGYQPPARPTETSEEANDVLPASPELFSVAIFAQTTKVKP